ncbi:Lrp/AsnC family transcriptional regulator [Pseudolysinimonas kribbensis]|uniref:Lrp/AsnC family transcriptional regulator n=1 Tax=Pseudolysinimonas kribbensis TaxID=433641 RepID=UPI0031D72BA9
MPSESSPPLGVRRNDVRRDPDAIDRRLLELLRDDARMPNARLAAEVGLAPSSCLARVRALVDAGVIAGFHAQLDPRALGLGLEALISVNIRSGARQTIAAFAEEVRALPEVTQVYFLGGAEDFILDVATRDSDHLREFVVENLSSHPSVASTRTSVVFEHTTPGLRIG